MSWSDNRRISTDIGWYMPYFTTAEYGWQVREPIHDMLIRIVDNTYDPEYSVDYREDIHFIADQMMAPDRKVDGKDARYVSTVKKYLVSAFHMLDMDRSRWEYVGPGGTPYPFDEPCDDEIIDIWNAIDPTIVREKAYKAFMKLAYGDWINYDKTATNAESPKTVVCVSLTKVTVHGTTNGLGTMVRGKNLLEPRTTPIPNGCEGTLLGTAFSYRDAEPGYTFNSGNATRIYITCKRTNDANIVAGDTGDLMLVEGSTIPSSYDADTNLYKHGLLQGSSEWHDPEAGEQGKSQLIYDSENEYGPTSDYNSAGRNIRCKTYPIMLEPNTTYSVRLFNSSYSEVQFGGTLLTEPGTITPQFQSLVNQKSIPDNETFVANNEQWIGLAYSHYKPIPYRPDVPIDLRPIRYEFCEYYADLKAGTYKLMVDIWGNNNWGSKVGFQGYTGCFEDNFNGQQSGIYEWFAVVDEDNNIVKSKTRLIESSEPRESTSPPYPNYYHKEYEITLASDTKIGLIHKAYYTSRSYAEPAYFRFYIVDADEEAEEFTTTDCSPTNMSGYSAWEPYQMVVSVNVQFTDVVAGTSTTLTKTIPSLLYSNDTLDFTEDLPSYHTADSYGIVTVEVLDKDQEDPTIVPTIDISYH